MADLGMGNKSVITIQDSQKLGNLTYHSDITIEVIDQMTDIQLLEDEWDYLVKNSTATIYQTYDWQYYWWKHFANQQGEHLFIILFRLNGELIGIAPFFIKSYYLMHYRIFKRLMILGTDLQNTIHPVPYSEKKNISDYLDIVAKYGFEKEVAGLLVSLLDKESHLWDEIDLQNIREDGIIFNYVMPLMSTKHFSIHKKISGISQDIKLTDLQDEYSGSVTEESVNGKFVKDRNSLSQNSEYVFKEIAGKENIKGGLQTLSNLHQSELNTKGYPGFLFGQSFIDFQKDLTSALDAKNLLWFNTVAYKGKNLVMHLGYKMNSHIYPYISGYELGYLSDQSDASGLRKKVNESMIEMASQSNAKILDITRNKEVQNLKLKANSIRKWDIRIRLNSGSRKSPELMNRSLIKASSLLDRISARMRYENEIFKIIRSEYGTISGIQSYIHHFFKRIVDKWKYRHIKSVLGSDKQRKGTKQFLSEDKISQDLNLDLPFELFKDKAQNPRLPDVKAENMEMGILTSQKELEAIIQQWEKLESYFGNPLLAGNWFISAAQTFCPPNILKMVIVKNKADEIYAIAPLSLKGRLLPRLEYIGSSTLMEPGGFLYKDRESLIKLIHFLLDLKIPLFLKGIESLSPDVEVLEKELKSRSLITLIREEKIPLVSINGKWDDFEKRQISSSRRSSFRRLQRKAEKKGKLRFEVVIPTEENLEKYLDEVYRVEAANWKGRQGGAIKTQPSYNKFYRIYSERAVREGELCLFFLKIDEKNIAVQLTVIHANKLWIYKIGHDEEWSWCSPGILLMNKVIHYCFDKSFESCEFLGSDETWLHIWANDTRNLVTYEIYSKSIKGMADLLWNRFKSFYHNKRIAIRSMIVN